ncbi:predicted protein [Micromonas commoda]|uniref:CSC1/OSCA1-like 7TM region domain-containing protein n=1 Tax=Micromonas commoda (strain RCC299 / NOUM17 / CCMP2709) TaxID=296587 RepID=C1E6Z2_MICCC|nr:predicted protein [Micromonas commoda]ACO63515.1 predicted protein [Micromonas commoda]|eukprot:XP_002502257.1 predicted protein [Micromonas commoda]
MGIAANALGVLLGAAGGGGDGAPGKDPSPAPPFPPPPQPPSIPHLILGSLRYTLEFDAMLAVPLVLLWFFWRLDHFADVAGGSGRGGFGGANGGGVNGRRRRWMGVTARCSQLRRVWNTSGDEVTRRCGADARDYLVVQRLILCALLGACVPGLGILLPLAMHLGSGTDGGTFDEANLFARTTVHHLPNGSPYLWAVVLTSAVAVVCVEWIADEISVSLVRMRYARAELMASVAGTTILLRRLPRTVTDDPAGLERALERRFPGRVHRVVVPRDGAESRARRRLARARARLASARRERRNTRSSGGGSAGGGATVGTPVGGATEGTPAHVGASSLLFGAGEEDADVAGGVNVLEHRVRAVAKAEEDLRRVTTDPNTGRRADGSKPPPPGCAFVVFRDPLTARRALTALKRTTRGALVALAWHAWMLPFAAARALAPGFGGGRFGFDGDGFDERGSTAAGRAAAAAARRDAARRDTLATTTTTTVGAGATSSSTSADLTEPLIVADEFAADDSASFDDVFGAGGFDVTGVTGVTSSGRASFDPSEMPAAVALAVGAGAHNWRVDHAPPPSGVLWDNVGVGAASRFARLWAVNGAMFLGLVFVSSPLALFSFVNDAAKTLNPELDFQWDQWVAWANGRGYLAGFVFQFLPNLGVLVVIYLLIPKVMERATRAERHLTRSGALRSLVSKEFWFFLINLLLLLALGKAALSATVQQVRQCQWRTAPDACEDRFLRILGDSFVASSAMSICGFLCTCCTLGPAWELLSFLSWLRGEAAAKLARKGKISLGAMTRAASSAEFGWRDGFDDGFDGGASSGGVSPRLPASASSLLAAGSDPDGNRSSDVQIAFRPAFDLPGQHAFNVTVLACALAYAALAPALLVPGTAFFAVRYLVHKHNLLCLHLDNVAGAGDGLFGSHDAAVVKDGPAGSPGGVAHGAHGGTRTGRVAKKASDGRLLATVVKIIRVSAFVHAAVMAAFMNLRGTPAQVACADIILCVLLLRPHAETLFGGGGGGGGGGGRGGGGGYYLAGRRAGQRRPAGGGDGDGGGPQFGAGIDAAEASALGVGPPGPSGAHHHRGASMASSIGGGGWTLDASPEILLEAGRYAGPWGGVDDADLRDVHLTHGSHGGFSSHAMATMEPSFSFATPAAAREETPTPSYGRRAKTRSRIGLGGGGEGEGEGEGEEVDEEGGAAASRPLLTRVVGDYESESDEE